MTEEVIKYLTDVLKAIDRINSAHFKLKKNCCYAK